MRWSLRICRMAREAARCAASAAGERPMPDQRSWRARLADHTSSPERWQRIAIALIEMTEIRHVSDTARWVAFYRAMETQRPDALFHDPFASKLAGTHGEAIVDNLPRGRQMAWAMIVRTQVFDEIIRDRIRTGGVDLVLNLAAGLDARPWRLTQLPPSLQWVDVDLPGILDYKLEALAGEKTVCHYDAVRLDLTDSSKRG